MGVLFDNTITVQTYYIQKNTLNLYVPYVSISIESRQLRHLSLHKPYKDTAGIYQYYMYMCHFQMIIAIHVSVVISTLC